ncbi:DUF389 domain-containing protein [Haloarcula litorea]|uniref:DUF389 domain-containing protein n=1 Tax=Haloarcula litorea TaxID=3032579 RepID=UPI0023E76156|nr:DUF389 domain-containing protein [Halomicroarcula sp. GDY20]
MIRWGYLVPPRLAIENITQVNAFSIPIVLTFVIAVFAGAAGALALATDLSVSLAGVAVAAAIVPAAAAIGLGIVWAKPALALGAMVLLLMNVLLINVSAFLALTAFGYRSESSTRVRDSLRVDGRTVGYGALAAVVAVLLVASVASTVQYLFLVETVNHNANEVFDREEYRDLELIDIQTDYSGPSVLAGQRERSGSVTVVVGRRTTAEYPRLAPVLRDRIAADVARAVTVRVRFVEYQVATPNSLGGAGVASTVGTARA